jgi:hypothetical protein
MGCNKEEENPFLRHGECGEADFMYAGEKSLMKHAL